MPFHKKVGGALKAAGEAVGRDLLELGKAFPDQPVERKRIRQALLDLGKRFPEEKVPGYRELEPKARKLLYKARAPDRFFKQLQKDLRKLRKELK